MELTHVCSLIPFHISLPFFLLTFSFFPPLRGTSPRAQMNSAARVLIVPTHTHLHTFTHFLLHSLSLLCVCVCVCVDEVVSWRSFPMRASEVREDCGALDGCTVVVKEQKEGGGRSYINSCWLRGLSSWQKPRQEWDALRGAQWQAFGANETQTKPHLISFFSLFWLPGVFQGILRSAKEWRKRCRDECCVVLHAPEGSPLLIKAPKRTTKQGCPWYFPQRRRLQRWSD